MAFRFGWYDESRPNVNQPETDEASPFTGAIPAPGVQVNQSSKKYFGIAIIAMIVAVLFMAKSCSKNVSTAPRVVTTKNDPSKIQASGPGPSAPPTANDMKSLATSYEDLAKSLEKTAEQKAKLSSTPVNLGNTGSRGKLDPVYVQENKNKQDVQNADTSPEAQQLEQERRQEQKQREEEARRSLHSSPFYSHSSAHSGFRDSPVVSSLPQSPDQSTPIRQVSSLPGGGPNQAKPGEPLDFDPSKVTTYPLKAGLLIEGVLENSLDGENVGPVLASLTRDVYFPGTESVAIPQGSTVIGDARAVGGMSEERIVVTFRRIITPGIGGYGIPLEHALPGLSESGESGLHDKVNRHYASIFGASLAIGAIGGIAQIGNTGSIYDPVSGLRSGISQSMAQSSSQVLNHFLQRKQDIQIRKGNRLTIMLLYDLPVPIAPSEKRGGGSLPSVPRRVDDIAKPEGDHER